MVITTMTSVLTLDNWLQPHSAGHSASGSFVFNVCMLTAMHTLPVYIRLLNRRDMLCTTVHEGIVREDDKIRSQPLPAWMTAHRGLWTSC